MVLLAISDGKLHCRDQANATHWTVALRDIVVIAEYTTRARPDCDDYFLVFVTRESGELFYLEVTGCAAGIPEVLEQLEGSLGCAIEPKLQNSMQWASRVLYPRVLAGSPFYEFEETVPATFVDRIRAKIKGKQITRRVADPILRFLNEPAPPAAGLAS